MGAFLQPLDDFKQADLPQKTKPNWKLMGPGAILVGLSIGAGEIIIWPRIAAEYGGSMVWAAVLGVFLQMWINLEIGRWTIATGETVYTGYCRVWRGFAFVFILLTLFGWLAPGWGQASGLAVKALITNDPYWHQRIGDDGKYVAIDFWGTKTFWTMLTFVGVALVLFGPKLIYKSVERSVEALVVVVVVGLVVVAIAVGTADAWADLGRGILNVGYVDPEMNVKSLFIAVVFAGAGGTANLFYTFYLRDKHIGMGARVPAMQNVLRGRAEKIPATGFRFTETDENRRRFKAWWRFVNLDQVLFFWLLNTFTILLFIFGALAVLHPRVLGKDTLIWDQVQILGQVWGRPGQVIFLIVGVATLFSTQLALLDGVGRSLADIVYTNFTAARRRDVSWWYVVITGCWIVFGCALTGVMEYRGTTNLGILFSAAYIGGFAMAIYVPLTLYINLRYLPKSARPGGVCTTMMIIASLVYVGFAVSCICWEVGSMLAELRGEM